MEFSATIMKPCVKVVLVFLSEFVQPAARAVSPYLEGAVMVGRSQHGGACNRILSALVVLATEYYHYVMSVA